MRKVTLAGGVEIDCCDAHGVWLDVGELAALLNQREQPEAQPARKKEPGSRQDKGAFDGAGRRLVQGVAHGAGFGAGTTLASTLIRKILG
jgi:Zn-finger nucleic acid-binding protein